VIVGHSRADILSRVRKDPASSLFAIENFRGQKILFCAIKNFDR